MDLLDLYHKSLRQPINQEEEQWVQEVIDSHPYFALPYYLLARKSETEEDLFKAATHAPNRTLLRNYMEGQRFSQPPVVPRDDSPQIPLRKNQSVERELAYAEHDHNLLFSLLDFNNLSKPPLDPFEALSIYSSERKSRRDEFINVKVKELSLKYLYLVSSIKNDLKDENLDNSLPLAEPPLKTISSQFQPEKKDTSDVSSMLEKFLENRPSPKQMLARAEDAYDEDAVDSINRDDDMVTETLARLNAKQGNISEAVRIYRKLRLLFPEKSAYFDGQIKQIE